MSNQDFRIARERIEGQPPRGTAWLAIEDIDDNLKLPYRADDRIDALTPGQRALYVLHRVQPIRTRTSSLASTRCSRTASYRDLAAIEDEFFTLLDEEDIYDVMGRFVDQSPRTSSSPRRHRALASPWREAGDAPSAS